MSRQRAPAGRVAADTNQGGTSKVRAPDTAGTDDRREKRNAIEMHYRSWSAVRARCSAAPRCRRPQRRRRTRIYVPLLTYRTGPFAGSRHSDRQRHARLSDHAERARRRHRRRQDRGRGVRDRLRHQEGRRVLRSGQGQEARGREPVLDRHHARAHPEGGGRQDPDPVDGLRPVGLGDRQRLPLDLQPAGDLLGRPVDDPHATSATRKAGSTSSRARPSATSSSTAATAASRSRCSSSSPRITASP